MTEDKRFTYENHKVNDTLTGDIHSSNRVSVNVLNELHEENEKLKDALKEIGYEFKKYSYEETGKKIEDYNTEKLLISLLQNIINELQDGWFVAEYESDFSNMVDINTLRIYEKNFCMKVSLRRTKPRELFF